MFTVPMYLSLKKVILDKTLIFQEFYLIKHWNKRLLEKTNQLLSNIKTFLTNIFLNQLFRIFSQKLSTNIDMGAQFITSVNHVLAWRSTCYITNDCVIGNLYYYFLKICYNLYILFYVDAAGASIPHPL